VGGAGYPGPLEKSEEEEEYGYYDDEYDEHDVA
jgi:hypothetical protein